MTTLNCYATLTELKNYITARGGTISTDYTDDAVMESLLKSSSRYIDSKTGRQFYPEIATRYYSVPHHTDPRLLTLDGDLLEVLSITNGDGATIASTEYKLRPKNVTPYIEIRLNDSSTYYWSVDSAGDEHDVIAVSGLWGYHDRYSRAWSVATTANEAMDASETGYDVTSASAFSAGDIIRFDNELGYVSGVTTSTLTVTRGENGSTATTHLTSINISRWLVMDECKTACLEIANNAYRRRMGQNSTSNSETITAAGIVLSPREIPVMAKEFIETYRDRR